MNCKECRRLLEDFHDEELNESKAARVRQHLVSCAACAAELAALKSEQLLFERYRESQSDQAAGAVPKWELVRDRITRREEETGSRAAGGFGWLQHLAMSPMARQVAFASLLVLVSTAVTLIIVRSNRPGPPVETVTAPATNAAKTLDAAADADNTGLESAMRSVRRAEQEYILAIKLLNEIVNRRKPTLDPRLVLEIETNLKAIDASIAATRRAYYERPSDPDLAQYMLAAYSKKVELLQELAT